MGQKNQKSKTILYSVDVWALICCRSCAARAPQLTDPFAQLGSIKCDNCKKMVTSLQLRRTMTDCVKLSPDGTLWLPESCRIVKTHSSGYCTPEILRRIGLASSIMSQLDRVWRQTRLSNTTKFRIYNSCVLSSLALCSWNMDTIESWYSETGGLSYDEPKANTWHLLVWICHERGSRHPLTTAVHKWS